MRLIALCPVRGDAWSLAASARAALRWCDDLIVSENARWADPATTAAVPCDPRVTRITHDAAAWDEADIRLNMLEVGRRMGGTHFALVDADELLTANLVPRVRDMADALAPGAGLRLPWLHLWRSLDRHRVDPSPFGRYAATSVLFRDHPRLTYRHCADGYQIHMRAPAGVEFTEIADRDAGLMHMQHVVWRRVVAKQAMYRMVEHLRWGGTRPAAETNQRYRPATDEAGLKLDDVPPAWWQGQEGIRELIDLTAEPWQENEVRRLLAEYGPGQFAGLDLAIDEILTGTPA